MATEVVYRCKNTGGPDGDCEHAASGETIQSSAVTINDSGDAICPGETVFGEPCGAILEEVIPPKKMPWALIGGVAASLFVVVGITWFIFLRGDALLRVAQTSIALAPGQSAKVEVFNDGEITLTLDDVSFSSDSFMSENLEDGLEIEPGESGHFRVKFSANTADSAKATMTIDSNSAGEPVIVELMGNANPWSVADKLNSKSTILAKE
ncbi:hypothetical protein VroAM7_11010 [Vibrio rotiferianus]|uniref:HYDIN/VesB/CFA65-like Ig-like domain-containing protein n=1 Tax=Vibrio rotiferianus TaxID=190895 RepID=A0A510I5F9_9VIBR|nr:DUF1573 domain-containing protein [Vibrio rotiferianus]BBL88448.1 hypothetical protein VroAM7_11010 [Vibrio rotiferianus]